MTFHLKILSEQAMVRSLSPDRTPSQVWIVSFGLIGTVPMPHSILDRSIPFDESAWRLKRNLEKTIYKVAAI